ncbi:ATP-binding protein [Streptomyces jumonjinensis]|uniref:ATP-binding protein n=1 Tax=Streptomyces jumonjinensis TaxID=1945 RepID=UPI0037BA8303
MSSLAKPKTAVVYTCAPDAAAAMSSLRLLTAEARARGLMVAASISDCAPLDLALADRPGWARLSRLFVDAGAEVLVVRSASVLAPGETEREIVLDELGRLGVSLDVRQPAAWETEAWKRSWRSRSPAAAEAAPSGAPCGLPPVRRCSRRRTAPPGPGSGTGCAPFLCRAAFPAHDAYTGEVRQLFRDQLALWGLGLTEAVDDVLLAAHELVANAIRHGSQPGDPVTVTMTCTAQELRVAVEDVSSSLPRLNDALDFDTFGSTSGRGMNIVEALAGAWGSTPRADGAGKEVWLSAALPKAA